MRIDILTLFPAMFESVLGVSILGRANRSGLASYHLHDVRNWAIGPHRKVDDRPFGGGPGMVMMCKPLHDGVRAVEAMDEARARRILLTPQGERLDQARVESLAREQRLLLIAGRYEGIDERVVDELEPLELSIGDYVLSGGELPAMVLLDAVVRLIPGVLGDEASAAADSFGVPGERSGTREGGDPHGRLLDCPHYTRPQVWKGRAVPEVLLGGDHEAVAEWRLMQRIDRTRRRRPDLLAARRDGGKAKA